MKTSHELIEIQRENHKDRHNINNYYKSFYNIRYETMLNSTHQSKFLQMVKVLQCSHEKVNN